jgi:16S rRNA (guanine(966)-N(2))-methyltransferase RsmD
MTRIIAGAAKGRRLQTPAGLETRPTGARVRQTLFDVLAPRVPGCQFLDACAGSGAIGLEALSRGASRVVLVDRSAAAIRAIRENVKAVGAAGGEVEVLRQEGGIAIQALAEAGRRFDLIYLDPPYGSQLCEALLEAIAASGLLAHDGLLVAEHFKKHLLPERIGRLSRTRVVRVGDHALSFYACTSGGGVS